MCIRDRLKTLAYEGYTYQGHDDHLPIGVSAEGVPCGDIEVEMQWFTRRSGTSVISGVDKALTMLKECTGYFEGDKFINTADKLEVWSVQDGDTTTYNGNPLNVKPVICLLYTSPSPRDRTRSRMPSS